MERKPPGSAFTKSSKGLKTPRRISADEERARVSEKEAMRREQLPDWAKLVDKMHVSAATMRSIAKELRRPARPTSALRKLMRSSSANG